MIKRDMQAAIEKMLTNVQNATTKSITKKQSMSEQNTNIHRHENQNKSHGPQEGANPQHIYDSKSFGGWNRVGYYRKRSLDCHHAVVRVDLLQFLLDRFTLGIIPKWFVHDSIERVSLSELQENGLVSWIC